MKWEIKHGLRQDTLFDASQEKTATIRRKKNHFLVFDNTGNMIYQIEKKEPLAIKITGENEGTAQLTLAPEQSLFIPPRAEIAEIFLEDIKLTMHQTQKRDYEILSADKQIGKITGIMHHNTQINIADDLQPGVVSVLYVLAQFMLHEDDIDIV